MSWEILLGEFINALIIIYIVEWVWFQPWDKSPVEFIHKVMALSSSIIFFHAVGLNIKGYLYFLETIKYVESKEYSDKIKIQHDRGELNF